MTQSHPTTMANRHDALEAKIADERARPRPDDTLIARLKKEKLRLKEALDRPV